MNEQNNVATQSQPSPDYMSYLLRLWRTWDGEGEMVWRASLETPGTRDVRNFPCLDALDAFLKSQTCNPQGAQKR